MSSNLSNPGPIPDISQQHATDLGLNPSDSVKDALKQSSALYPMECQTKRSGENGVPLRASKHITWFSTWLDTVIIYLACIFWEI